MKHHNMHGVCGCNSRVTIELTLECEYACTVKRDWRGPFCDLSSFACAAWLEQGTLQRLVMVISSIEPEEVLERWTFMVQTDKDAERQG